MATIVLLTSKDCPPCADVEKKFNEKYAEEIKSGDAQVINTDENDVAKDFATQNGLGLGTHMIVLSDDSKLMAKLDIDKELPPTGPTPLPAEGLIHPKEVTSDTTPQGEVHAA